MYGLQHTMAVVREAAQYLRGSTDPEARRYSEALSKVVESSFNGSEDLQVITRHCADGVSGECFWCGEGIGPQKFLDVRAWGADHFKTRHPDRRPPFPERDRGFRPLPYGNDLGASSR